MHMLFRIRYLHPSKQLHYVIICVNMELIESNIAKEEKIVNLIYKE